MDSSLLPRLYLASCLRSPHYSRRPTCERGSGDSRSEPSYALCSCKSSYLYILPLSYFPLSSLNSPLLKTLCVFLFSQLPSFTLNLPLQSQNSASTLPPRQQHRHRRPLQRETSRPSSSILLPHHRRHHHDGSLRRSVVLLSIRRLRRWG